MLIDIHGHLWLNRIQESKDIALKLRSTYGIRMVFISTLLSHDPDEEEIRLCNAATRDFMREEPEYVQGMAYLNPAHANCLDELKRCVEEEGMSGVKLWVATLCDDRRVDPIAEAAIGYRIPILAHVFKKTVGQLPYESLGLHAENLGRRYPELTLIAAHLGMNVYDTVKCIKDCKNIYADFSGSMFRRDDLDYAVHHLGAERILFGSDMPGSFENCLGQVEGAALTAEQRGMIYSGNACKLFGLGGLEP